MATPTRIESDVYIAGNLRSQTMSIPNGTLVDAAVNAAAGIAATKLEHQYNIAYAQASGATAAAESRVLTTCYGATGDIISFKAGSVAPCAGNATVTVDLTKNGTSVLSAAITLDSANTARVVEAGTISTATMVAGDVLEAVIAVNAGTGTLALGVFGQLITREDAA